MVIIFLIFFALVVHINNLEPSINQSNSLRYKLNGSVNTLDVNIHTSKYIYPNTKIHNIITI